MSLDQEPIIFNPLDPGYMENPFAHLAELRVLDPVHYSFIGVWILFRHADVFRLLRDPSLSVDDANATNRDPTRANLFIETIKAEGHTPEPSYSILNIDPPDHTRLRRLVSQAFTPRTIENLRPMIEDRVDAVLDRFEQGGPVDLVSELAFPLPFDVISEMLGMPAADTEMIRDWSEALVKTLDPIVSDDEIRAAVKASIKLDEYIDGVIAWKRERPGEDLLTDMIEAEEDGDRMTSLELRDQVGLLFVAGHETTVNLIGTGIYELLRRPDQMAKWVADPDLAGNAVEELLRFVSPVQFTRRISTHDIDFGDASIEKGHFILASLASANRDPELWGPTADELDLTRENAAQHVSFGSGAHYCLGASLAKLEAQVAIGSFIRRFPNTTIKEVAWNGRINLRGLSRLLLDVGAGAGDG